jgi:hypothetical protein
MCCLLVSLQAAEPVLHSTGRWLRWQTISEIVCPSSGSRILGFLSLSHKSYRNQHSCSKTRICIAGWNLPAFTAKLFLNCEIQVLTAASMKMDVLWVVAPCSLVAARGLRIALMMEAARSSETSEKFCQTTRHNNPEDIHLYVFKLAGSYVQKLSRRGNIRFEHRYSHPRCLYHWYRRKYNWATDH